MSFFWIVKPLFISTFAFMRGFGRSALNGRDKLKIL